MGFVFFASLILWSLYNWPALRQAWFYTDDYPRIEGVAYSLPFALNNGRPVEWLLFQAFRLENGPDWRFYNVGLRYLQGILHCLAATLAAYLLWIQNRRWIALASILPFVLWPFNGEAVLWRMASEYPLAAFISILGVYLASFESKPITYKILAALLICIAVLANQLAAMAGFIVWLVVVGCNAAEEDFSFGTYRWGQFLSIISGYMIGGLVSFITIHQFAPFGDRSKLAIDFWDKLSFLSELNKLFITWPEFYPGWLKWLQVLLLAGSVGWFVFRAYQRRAAWKAVVRPLIVLAALFVVPYAPLLVVAESWPAFRVMYLAPFSFTMALNLFTLGDKGDPKYGWMPFLFSGMLLIGYLPISWVNSAEYVTVFKGDLQVLQRIESAVAKWNANQVAVASFPDYIYDWNPYQIKYLHGDSKISAFQNPDSWQPFVRLFSGLSTVQEDAIYRACIATCNANEREHPFEYHHLNQGSTLCVCP